MKRLLLAIACIMVFEGCSRDAVNNANNIFVIKQAETGRCGNAYFFVRSTNSVEGFWFADSLTKFAIGDTIILTQINH